MNITHHLHQHHQNYNINSNNNNPLPQHSSPQDHTDEQEVSQHEAEDDQLNYQTLQHDNMLQMQAAPRVPLNQFPYASSFYPSSYEQYPAPSPPAISSGPLLNDREYQSLNGYLETLNDEALTYDSKLDIGFSWDEEPSFPLIETSQSMPTYLGAPLLTSRNSLQQIDNLSPVTHSPISNMPAPSSSSPNPPIIVNPFDEAHGLIPQSTSRSNNQSAPEAALLNTLAWGSDPHFSNNLYHAPTQTVTDHDIQRRVLSVVKVAHSTGHTTTNSPVEIKFERHGEDIGSSDVGSNFTSGNTQSPTLSANQSSGVKRRAEDDEDHHQQHTRKSRTRKGSVAEPKGKRGGKRDQLTEAEKRANHIHSEQKRRNQIKNGFDTLTELVPDLKGGGYSKSAVLQHAAVYVDNLRTGNTRLKHILRDLELQHKAAGTLL
ncbi:hypothetical protein DFH27DRAFT_527445 [Peziza echinospora]|nr:hypothetical protein DFH27DRAFT_527445 [Peziza echinospora]